VNESDAAWISKERYGKVSEAASKHSKAFGRKLPKDEPPYIPAGVKPPSTPKWPNNERWRAEAIQATKDLYETPLSRSYDKKIHRK